MNQMKLTFLLVISSVFGGYSMFSEEGEMPMEWGKETPFFIDPKSEYVSGGRRLTMHNDHGLVVREGNHPYTGYVLYIAEATGIALDLYSVKDGHNHGIQIRTEGRFKAISFDVSGHPTEFGIWLYDDGSLLGFNPDLGSGFGLNFYKGSGRIKQLGRVNRGNMEGMWEAYSEDGKLIELSEVRNGKLETIVKEPQGLERQTERLIRSVSIDDFSSTCGSVSREGSFFRFNETEELIYQSISDGKVSGPRFVSHPDGKAKEFSMWKDGVKSGPVFKFSDEGLLASYHNFSNDEIDGIAINFFPRSGLVESIGHYSKGEKAGLWEYFSAVGELIETVDY